MAKKEKRVIRMSVETPVPTSMSKSRGEQAVKAVRRFKHFQEKKRAAHQG